MAFAKSSHLASAALLLGALALALGAADDVLRWLERPEIRGPLAWKTTVDWSEGTNEFGFRGKKVSLAHRGDRFLLLGDSQLEGYHTKLGDTFAAKLQFYLRHREWPAQVLALGAGGWGTDQQLIALQFYIDDIDPAQVVVFYTHANDSWNTLFPTHLGTPKPTFQLVDGELVSPDPWLWRAPRVASGGNTRAPYGLLPTLRRVLYGGYPSDADWEANLPPRVTAPPAAPDTPLLADVYEAALGLELHESEDLRSERSHFAHLVHPATPRQRYALDLQRALFREMKRECDARGIPLRVFVPRLLPELWEGEFAHDGRAYALSSRAAAQRLRDLFADLDIALLEINDLQLEHTWLPKDMHLNPAGNRFVAERVGDWLLQARERR